MYTIIEIGGEILINHFSSQIYRVCVEMLKIKMNLRRISIFKIVFKKIQTYRDV